jgi:ketosteroid isomerase-like protein
MRTASLVTVLVLCGVVLPTTATLQEPASGDRLMQEIVALERAALDRWIALDPHGYLRLYAPDVTYFDPFTDVRVDGLKAMQKRLAPMKSAKSPFIDRRYDMIGVKVQGYGDVALLTYNLTNYGKPANQAERLLSRWNCTELYGRRNGTWVLLHTHWSFTKPEIKQPKIEKVGAEPRE